MSSEPSEADRLLEIPSNSIPEYQVQSKPIVIINNNASSKPKSSPGLARPAAAATPTVEDEDVKEEDGSTLMIAFFLMLFFQLGNRIFGRLETFPMHNYPLYMNLLSTCIYVPICFAYILPVVWSKSNAITKTELEIPKYKFGVMGFYDSVAGIMQTFATNYISNSGIIVLVSQSAIPISMVISKYFLKAEYTNAQYGGAAVVLFGIFLVLSPTFFTSHTNKNVADANPYELVWILVLMVSCVPMCLSSVYKEQALGETEINIIYLNGWVGVFQSLFAIPLSIPSAKVINMNIDQIIPNLHGGALCTVGINTLENDNCRMAPLFVSLYLSFNIVYNFLIVVILKHGSANILWMASTVIVPLSNVAFSLKFMPGSKPLGVMDIVGLFVIMSGLIMYRFMPQLIETINRLRGITQDIEESEQDAIQRRISRVIAKKYTKYVGFNQIESLQTLIDNKILHEQKEKKFYRTTSQIRGNLLMKLGIPPSPAIDLQYGVTGGKRSSPFATPIISKRFSDARETDPERQGVATSLAKGYGSNGDFKVLQTKSYSFRNTATVPVMTSSPMKTGTVNIANNKTGTVNTANNSKLFVNDIIGDTNSNSNSNSEYDHV